MRFLSLWISGIEVNNTTLLSFNRHPITLMVGVYTGQWRANSSGTARLRPYRPRLNQAASSPRFRKGKF
jgi:hypothetical protein